MDLNQLLHAAPIIDQIQTLNNIQRLTIPNYNLFLKKFS